MCEIYDRRAEIWAYDSERGARKLRTFHEVNTTGNYSNNSLDMKPAVRLSYYGGGHYDSITDDNFDSTIIRLYRPGEIEDHSIECSKQRQLLATSMNTTTTPNVSTNTSTIDRNVMTTDEAINHTIELSRRDLGWAEEDLDTCLALSLQDEETRFKNTKLLITDSENSHPTKVQDLIDTQSQLLSQAVESSEREYIEKALISSLEEVEKDDSEQQLLQQILHESVIETNKQNIQVNSNMDPLFTAADKEIDIALKLAQLSEEEALELALKQSLTSLDPIKTTSIPTTTAQTTNNVSTNPISPNDSHKVQNPSIVPQINDFEDDEYLKAALAASMMDASNDFHYQANHYIDEDEEMLRAIAESLK